MRKYRIRKNSIAEWAIILASSAMFWAVFYGAAIIAYR